MPIITGTQKTKTTDKPVPTESQIQKSILQWVRLNPRIEPFVIHIPNEGKRTPSYGKLMKDLGLKPGVSDLFVASAHHGYHGAWIELKRPKGRLTILQNKFLSTMASQGYFTSVCYSVDEGIGTIRWYCEL